MHRARAAVGRLLRKLGRHSDVDPAFPVPASGGAPAHDPPGPLADGLFVNPVGEGADPHVVRDGDRYLWCQSEGNVGVAIWVSDRLTSMGRKHVVWWAPADGPYSREVWAPELHRFDGRWYIYLAASNGDNRNHRTYALESTGSDPLGRYDVCGPLWTGDGLPGEGTNSWSIDLTLLVHQGRRYGVWSGWSTPDDDLQDLYIAEMSSPTVLAGPRVRLLGAGSHLWQRTEETASSRGLLEGPQVLSRGDRIFLVYSCAASWLPTYKLGMLELTGDDPLDPAAWTRFDEPVFVSNTSTYGVGHGSFVRALEGDDWWHVFHAKRDRRPGWRRGLFVQPIDWDDGGAPLFGTPVGPGTPLPSPAGTPRRPIGDRRTWQFTDPESAADFDYYGHHQFVHAGTDGLHLGRVPAAPVNDYRSGEKVVLRDGAYADCEVTARFRFVAGSRAAGLLVRATGPSVGYDAQRGYFAAIAADRAMLVLGKTDGRAWTLLAEVPMDVDPAAVHTVTVSAVGDRIEVTSGLARLEVLDGDYPRGSIGLRVVDTHACFTGLVVTPALTATAPIG